MKSKKILFILTPGIILILSSIALLYWLNSKNSMYPYKEKKEILECYDYFTRVQEKERRVEFLKNYLKKYFNVIEVHRLYQDFMIPLGEFGYIFNEYKNYLESHPDDPNFNYLYGRLLSDPSAESYFKKSLENNESFYWGHLGLAYYYLHGCNPPKNELAKDHLEKAIKIDKTKPNAYFSLLSLYRAENNKEKIFEILEILTRFFPERDYLFLEYADLRYKDKKELKKAIIRKLRRIPQSAMLKKSLADLYLLEEKIDKALNYLEEALRDEKDDTDLIQALHIEIAEIYGKKKDETRTLYHLKEAVRYGFKDSEWIKENKNFEFLRESKEFKDLFQDKEKGKNF